MAWKNTSSRYGTVSITLHWSMLLLIVAVSLLMELKGLTPKNTPQRETLAMWHYMLGLSVFLLVWLRLLARLAGDTPQVRPPLPQRQALLALWVHRALYLLMFGLPLLGWLTLSAKGLAIPFFGFELPALVAKDAGFAKWFKQLHETGATLGYLLVGLHAAAALVHHYVTKDNTLRLMAPGRHSVP